jgi:hypothetical protein
VRKTNDKKLVTNILRLTEHWEWYCAGRLDGLNYKIDMIDFKLSFFEGYPDLS